MLTHVQDLGFRIGEFCAEPISKSEITEILATLAPYYGTATNSAVLVPREDEAVIREALKSAVPRITALGTEIREALESNYSGILIPKLQLNQVDSATLGFVLFALALFIGSPTATDKIEKRIVWDIKAQSDKTQPGHVPTFSEHANEAELHTDTQYFQQPERYVLQYFIASSACGGGTSRLRDVTCIKEQLSRTEMGRWALDFLSQQELPFRIPTVFTTTGSRDAVEVTVGKIFGNRPSIRFRTDTLEKGLQAFPAYDTPEVRKALNILNAELNNKDLISDKYLDADNLLIINNHEALHGRSEFTDLQRHALRIRIADNVAQDDARVLLQAAYAQA
ncbi:MAG: TauD/TfdA family dioxygenase [Pseudomonadota bacterium]